MAHFAEINDNNEVLRVLVVDNLQEHRGEEFLSQDLGLGGRWIQTSYNNNFRKRFASVGGYYDQSLDAFVNPRPFPSWVLNTETADWVAPIPNPSDGGFYVWDEDSVSWKAEQYKISQIKTEI